MKLSVLFHGMLIGLISITLAACDMPQAPNPETEAIKKQLADLEARNNELRTENQKLETKVNAHEETLKTTNEKLEDTQKAIDTTSTASSAITRSKANLGETCGTIVGIECHTGLRCNNDTNVADSSGICIHDKKTSVKTTPVIEKIETPTTTKTTPKEADKLTAEMNKIKTETTAIKNTLNTVTGATTVTPAPVTTTTATVTDPSGVKIPAIGSTMSAKFLGITAQYPKYWWWNLFSNVSGSDYYIAFGPQEIKAPEEAILYAKVKKTGETGTNSTPTTFEITVLGPDNRYYTFGGPAAAESILRDMSASLQALPQ